MKKEGKCDPDLEHRQVKYLNNRLEADHGKLKRLIHPARGFKSMKTTYATIKGFEVMRMFRKRQMRGWQQLPGVKGEAWLVEKQFGIHNEPQRSTTLFGPECESLRLLQMAQVRNPMSANIDTALVVDAFNMGVAKRGRPPIVVHSDRGSQYTSDLFRGTLEQYDCIQSMSRKENCWDNAVAESFFGSLKSELIYRNSYISRNHARISIFDYIEIFYNFRRLHSVLGYLTPVEKDLKGKRLA